LPCAVALMVIALPLTAALYQRGAFTADDTAATALVLAIYGAGLPAFVLHKVYQPLYYAREDSRSPFRFAIVSMIINAAIAVGLMPYIGFAAAALATTLAGWMMAAQLWFGTKRMGDAARFDTRFRSRAPRIIIAAIVMGFALYGTQVALGEMLASHGWRYAGLALLITTGVLSYSAAGTAIGAFKLSDFRNLRRR
ncbi:MAG: lipid II flippase MurJ, partial [Cypionkella sp.]|nr:lipid II flippase MurJ [Cypionkella sp.]